MVYKTVLYTIRYVMVFCVYVHNYHHTSAPYRSSRSSWIVSVQEREREWRKPCTAKASPLVQRSSLSIPLVRPAGAQLAAPHLFTSFAWSHIVLVVLTYLVFPLVRTTDTRDNLYFTFSFAKNYLPLWRMKPHYQTLHTYYFRHVIILAHHAKNNSI